LKSLEAHLKWPDEDCCRELAVVFGIGDIKEFGGEKSKDPVKERRTGSSDRNLIIISYCL
jgi:hypothetical protein